jgi:hypothetical protein
VSALQFVAAILNSLAWPAAALAAVILLRHELARAFHRMRTLEFPGGKATFDSLSGYEKISEAAARDAGAAEPGMISGSGETEFDMLEALTTTAPQQAIIGAWGLLEYQLNVASDRVAPDQPRGWPQVARNLEAWDKWPVIYPVVVELRRLRDYTANSRQPPLSSDATRYVSVVQDLVTTLRASFSSPTDDVAGGD